MGPANDGVSLHPYDPAWAERFEAMRRALAERFGPAVGRIEHVGSTAVPGLAAKPVIDMLAEVRSFEEAEAVIRPALTEEGWEYIWRDDRPPGHMMFIRREPATGERTHHLHMAPADHRQLWERVAFRDYLRAHAEEARRYERLKRELAARHPSDRGAYTEGKAECVRAVTQRAIAEGYGAI